MTSQSRAYLDVAAAAIINAKNEVLIAKRAAHRHQGNLWEFPGGKLDPGETPAAALVRELLEELNITATSFRPLLTLCHQYPDKAVRLHVFRVDAFCGEPHGNEGQPLQWLTADALSEVAFPAANIPIVTAVQLPDRMLITPEPDETDRFLRAVELACRSGIHLLQLRAHSLSDAAYRELALQTYAITSGHDCRLMLNREPAQIADLPCDGWHLTSSTLRNWQEMNLKKPRWLSAACHNADEVAVAARIDADFLLLSPVAPTPTHPQAAPLGWSGFSVLAALANRPCFALGGLAPADLPNCWQHGGQGIAGIRAFWPQ